MKCWRRRSRRASGSDGAPARRFMVPGVMEHADYHDPRRPISCAVVRIGHEAGLRGSMSTDDSRRRHRSVLRFEIEDDRPPARRTHRSGGSCSSNARGHGHPLERRSLLRAARMRDSGRIVKERRSRPTGAGARASNKYRSSAAGEARMSPESTCAVRPR